MRLRQERRKERVEELAQQKQMAEKQGKIVEEKIPLPEIEKNGTLLSLFIFSVSD